MGLVSGAGPNGGGSKFSLTKCSFTATLVFRVEGETVPVKSVEWCDEAGDLTETLGAAADGALDVVFRTLEIPTLGLVSKGVSFSASSPKPSVFANPGQLRPLVQPSIKLVAASTIADSTMTRTRCAFGLCGARSSSSELSRSHGNELAGALGN